MIIEKDLIVWPMTIEHSIDVLFSHNERVALWYKSRKYNHESVLLWRGMGHEIPSAYNNLLICKVFGSIPESIIDADYINLLVNATDDTPKNLKKDETTEKIFAECDSKPAFATRAALGMQEQGKETIEKIFAETIMKELDSRPPIRTTSALGAINFKKIKINFPKCEVQGQVYIRDDIDKLMRLMNPMSESYKPGGDDYDKLRRDDSVMNLLYRLALEGLPEELAKMIRRGCDVQAEESEQGQ